MQWELNFLHWVWNNLHGSNFFNTLNKWVTWLGDTIQMTVIISVTVIIMLFFKKTRKTGIALGFATLFFGLLGNNVLIKDLVARPRPIYVDDGLLNNAQVYFADAKYNYIPDADSYSFMSGHAVINFLAAFVIAYYHRKAAIPIIIYATFAASTRLFFGFHYPTDTLFGILYAAIGATLTILLANWLEKIIKNKQKERVKNNEN